MTFEEWWNTKDYPASCKGNCMEAFNAVEEKAKKEIEELEEVRTAQATLLNKDIIRITNLEKENTELKEQVKHRNCVDCSNHGSNIKLLKAKEIIKKFLNAKSIEETCVAESEAEKFLKEE